MAFVGSLSGSLSVVAITSSLEPGDNNLYYIGTSAKKFSNIVASALSGSLTKLSDGSSFLVAGSNVTITTASNGQVTISSTGGGGSGASFFSSTTAGSIFTTGSAAFVGDEAGIDAPSDKGSDVSFYVSGSITAGSGVALFGGNVRSSGSLTLDGDAAVNGGDITTTAATFNLVNSVTTLNIGTSATTVNIGQASQAINVAGNLDVNGTADLAGTVTLSGNSQNVTHSGTGNLTIASTTGNVLIEGSTFSGNDVTIPGNLTVRGTTTSIDTTNLKVYDPLVLIGSGSTGPSAKGAIAFASGSATTDQALIIGPAGANNVMAVARQDVQDGGLNQASISFTTLVPFRASEFQVGGSTVSLSSADGSELTLKGNSTAKVLANNGALTLSGTVAGGIAIGFGGLNYGEIRDNGTSNLRLGTFAGELALSGSIVNLDAGQSGFRFKRDSNAQQFLNIFAPSSTVAQVSSFGTNRGLTLGTGGGTTDTLILSGTQTAFNNGNNGVAFQKNSTQFLSIFNPVGLTAQITAGTAANSTLKLSTNGGTTDTVALSGSIYTFTHPVGSFGIQVQKDGVQYLGIKYPSAGNAAIASTIGNDIFTINTTAGAGSTDKLILSGSTVELNGGVVNLQKDGTTFAFVGTDAGYSGLLPNTDLTYNLGSPTKRWANIYTGDLHLRNERGHYTIIEEPDYLSIRNNRTGKLYKFLVEEITDSSTGSGGTGGGGSFDL